MRLDEVEAQRKRFVQQAEDAPDEFRVILTIRDFSTEFILSRVLVDAYQGVWESQCLQGVSTVPREYQGLILKLVVHPNYSENGYGWGRFRMVLEDTLKDDVTLISQEHGSDILGLKQDDVVRTAALMEAALDRELKRLAVLMNIVGCCR